MNKLKLIPVIGWFIFALSCQSSDDNFTVQQGDFRASIMETGELEAIRSKKLSMPYIGWKYGWQYKVIFIEEHGKKVNKGDTVILVDDASVMKYKLENIDKLETEEANLNKLVVQHQNKIRDLQSQIKSLEAEFNLKKLEQEKFQFESEKKQEIKKLEFEKAQIKIVKAKRSLELAEVCNKNEMIIQKLKLVQLKNDIEKADHALSKLKLTSPMPGMFQVLQNRRTGQLVKVGDEIWQGMPIAIIPDLTEMRVKSIVHEEDIRKVKLGQKVELRLDAFPKKKYMGEITWIGKLSRKLNEDNDNIKVFDIEITLLENDIALKPGMTVSCEIITNEFSNVFYVKNECLIIQDSNHYIVSGSGKKIEVKTGPSNNTHTVVYGELKKGQQLLPFNNNK